MTGAADEVGDDLEGVPRGPGGFPVHLRKARDETNVLRVDLSCFVMHRNNTPSRPLLGTVFPGAPSRESPRSRRVRAMLVPSPHAR
jgi:hypothetical protein